MGFLDWRGWDRLDDLDRRTGIRPEATESSLRRHERFLWLGILFIVFMAVVNAVQRKWPLAGIAVLLAAWNGRALPKVRAARRAAGRD